MLSAPQLKPSQLLGPIATMADYQPMASAKVSDLRRRAVLVTKNFEKIAAHDPAGGRWRVHDEAKDTEVQESWRVSLSAMNVLLVELEGGFATARFVREVRKHAKDLAPRLDTALARARESTRQLAAWAAIMTGENDDERLGVEVIPPPPPEGARPRAGRSVPFEW